jgi:signal transduction histidine kinase/CheY-like chemotaxis protein
LVGQLYLRFVHPEDRARVNATYREQAGRGIMSTMQEFRLVTPGDEDCWVHFFAHPIFRDGAVVEMAGLALDITKRKKMERQLVQQERLAAVGQLAAGIAHDFRNLLSTIILYAEMDLRRSDLPRDLTRHLRVISRESHTASDLVQQILDFSSNAMLDPQPLDLETHTEKVLSTLRHTIPESITISLETGTDNYTIVADPARIQQAVTNLVLNARDAMPDGGEMRFALTRVDVGPGDPSPVPDATTGAWVCLSVSDTGMGMTEEVQAHLFEPFFTTKETGKGTGLGLAQVFGIVRQHEGHIDVETAPNEGTTFRIYLPIRDVDVETAPPNPRTRVPKGRGETVLLVEDEVGVRDAIQQVLTSLKYEVITASDGDEALSVCRSPARAVDMVVTDLVMPEMGGRQLLRELQSIRPDLPVMAITGYALEGDDLNALLDAGFVDVIFKPLDIERLVQSVRHVFDA